LRGTVLLIVDETQAEPLAFELARLYDDLRRDGWHVIRKDVSRTASVVEIKDWILQQYEKDPQRVRSVFLFGRIPVPYSGNFNPDAHPDHKGAWPADVYYADVASEWTDEEVNNDTSASREVNKNIPGDGKFDPSGIPYGAELLELGRVDLSSMTNFSMTETELLRQYLNKNHAFRHGELTAQRRALVDDNFNAFGGEAFAATAWRNFPNFVGYSNIEEKDWFETLKDNDYLWAYACGGGWYQGANGVGSTQDFATKGSKSIFNIMFGSYFGDWDVENSFLRAPLATTHGLINVWAGRPHWHMYPLAIGETFGYVTKMTQQNSGEYVTNYFYGMVHIALMGDPTLRMDYTIDAPPVVQVTTNDNARIRVSWNHVPAGAHGYHVYRASSKDGQFVQLTTEPLTDTFFVDAQPFVDTNVYQVRTLGITGGSFSSYINTSLASEGMITGILPKAVAAKSPEQTDIMNVNTWRNEIRVNLDLRSAVPVRLSITDMTGREVKLVDEGSLVAGIYNYRFENEIQAHGAYLIRLIAGKRVETEKVLLAAF
ncbi:MAG TPA: fibronectin type III domain-containing protein, partial [Candidatus Kapabacteria bacterium]|nr:fibronectin type III domain-containing protein [Candidatus Kapabacteria bacterium]